MNSNVRVYYIPILAVHIPMPVLHSFAQYSEHDDEHDDEHETLQPLLQEFSIHPV